MPCEVIKIRCKAKTKNSPKENIPEDSAVRIYKQSPEDICLQIRGERRYTSVTIYPQEARQIADVLYRMADLFLEPLAPRELEQLIKGQDNA